MLLVGPAVLAVMLAICHLLWFRYPMLQWIFFYIKAKIKLSVLGTIKQFLVWLQEIRCVHNSNSLVQICYRYVCYSVVFFSLMKRIMLILAYDQLISIELGKLKTFIYSILGAKLFCNKSSCDWIEVIIVISSALKDFVCQTWNVIYAFFFAVKWVHILFVV